MGKKSHVSMIPARADTTLFLINQWNESTFLVFLFWLLREKKESSGNTTLYNKKDRTNKRIKKRKDIKANTIPLQKKSLSVI